LLAGSPAQLMLITVGGFISLLIWAYLLLARGRFWQVGRLPDVKPDSRPPGLIAVIIPARNEADVVGECILSLLNQTCSESLHIFLVDDGSTDSTARIARETGVVAEKSAVLTIIEGQPLPPGWSGKLWALNQGVERARLLAPRFYLFTDADIVHQPESIASLASIAESGPYDLTSFMVKLHCQTLAEMLLIPPFVFFFFKLYPPSWVADPRRQTAAAAGGCMLVRSEALDRAGGIAAIRNQIIDDCALAREVKHTGGKVWLNVTNSARSIRRYGSFAEIGRMISRTAFNQLNHSAWMLIFSLAGLTLTYLLPPSLLLTHNSHARELGAAACAAMVLSYMPMLIFYRLNPLWALTLPAAATFYMGATIHSAVKFWKGRGGEWKGRAQDPPKKGRDGA